MSFAQLGNRSFVCSLHASALLLTGTVHDRREEM